MADYTVFDYQLPGESAEFYAAQAIAVLQELKAEFPDDFAKSFRCPSEVLTLSGARAFDTYYDLGADKDDAYKQRLRELLRKHGILLIDETMPAGGEDNPDNMFSIVNIEALQELPTTYLNLPFWQPFIAEAMQNDSDFMLWWLLWRHRVLLDGGEWQDGLLKTWMAHDLGAAHDLTFGMLLGYPGEAIASQLFDTTQESTKANIKYAAKYDGAQPVYSFSPDLADNPNIIRHQKLWSDILEIVYNHELFADIN